MRRQGNLHRSAARDLHLYRDLLWRVSFPWPLVRHKAPDPLWRDSTWDGALKIGSGGLVSPAGREDDPNLKKRRAQDRQGVTGIGGKETRNGNDTGTSQQKEAKREGDIRLEK